jgi:exodeoxyribonuclease III
MRIATWNVNGLRARLDFLKRWLEERQPDIVGMQELKITAEVFTSLGYNVAIHGEKGWNGVGIASRHAIEVETTGLPGQSEMGSRLITATIQGLSFTTVYVPNGKDLDHVDYPRKLQWLETLADHWSATHASGDAAILCGDFNVTPAAIDSWRGAAADGRLFHTPAERDRLRMLDQSGLYDLFREKYPDDQRFSWWDYRGGAFHRGQGLRIDFIYGTAPVLARVRDVTIDRDYRKKQDGLTASDHAPVIVELD